MGSYFSEELSGPVGEVPGQPQSGVLDVSYLMVNQNQDDLGDPANSQWSGNLNQEEYGLINLNRLWSVWRPAPSQSVEEEGRYHIDGFVVLLSTSQIYVALVYYLIFTIAF